MKVGDWSLKTPHGKWIGNPPNAYQWGMVKSRWWKGIIPYYRGDLIGFKIGFMRKDLPVGHWPLPCLFHIPWCEAIVIQSPDSRGCIRGCIRLWIYLFNNIFPQLPALSKLPLRDRLTYLSLNSTPSGSALILLHLHWRQWNRYFIWNGFGRLQQCLYHRANGIPRIFQWSMPIKQRPGGVFVSKLIPRVMAWSIHLSWRRWDIGSWT